MKTKLTRRAAAMPAHTPSARLRGTPAGNVVAINARAVGAASAAPAPCTARAVSSHHSDVAKPPTSEASEKMRTPVIKTLRRPLGRPLRPPEGLYHRRPHLLAGLARRGFRDVRVVAAHGPRRARRRRRAGCADRPRVDRHD